MSTFNSANSLWRDTSRRVLEHGITVKNTKELIGASFCLENPMNNYTSIRNMSPYYAVGELCWYLSASNKLSDISYYSKFWNNIANEDGTCNSAYGYNIRKLFSFDQIQFVLQTLKENPDSRQAVIQIKDPNVKNKKDIPCTVYLQFFIREGKLSMITNMRSNDVYLGLPYDLFCFTEIQRCLASMLGIDMMYYIHQAGSIHIYDRHKDRIKKSVKNNLVVSDDYVNCNTQIPQEDYSILLHYESVAKKLPENKLLEIYDAILKGDTFDEVHPHIVGMILVIIVYALKNKNSELNFTLEGFNNVWVDRIIDFESRKKGGSK